jgi:hypothetical protein
MEVRGENEDIPGLRVYLNTPQPRVPMHIGMPRKKDLDRHEHYDLA